MNVAPCGINCDYCIYFMRDKNDCKGCRSFNPEKPKYCLSCKIRNCEKLAQSVSGFCGECDTFPCRRLKDLDKRYRLKYNTGLIDNLLFIKTKGIDEFIMKEELMRKCPQCGGKISIHKKNCLKCSN